MSDDHTQGSLRLVAGGAQTARGRLSVRIAVSNPIERTILTRGFEAIGWAITLVIGGVRFMGSEETLLVTDDFLLAEASRKGKPELLVSLVVDPGYEPSGVAYDHLLVRPINPVDPLGVFSELD